MTCPSTDSLLGFAAGRLSDDASASVESHIDTCNLCRGVLSNLARDDAPQPQFGRYRIDTVLGSGGMGIVYRAYDPQLARSVAIKVVKHAGDDGIRARLVREAQALAKVNHPNVCHVYDVGTEGEEVWVAMELIDGVTLRQWAGDRRDPQELLEALLAAGEGIAAAHAASIIHRDIKPENVLMTREGRAVVTDFGLARANDGVDPIASTQALQLAETQAAQLTQTGAIVGTPAYLAPEQLTGQNVDERVDQFTWAVMAWELITGVRPFPIVFASRLDAIRAGVTPPPTMQRTIAMALARAMAVSPRDRFPSMRALLEAMRARPAPPSKRSYRTGAIALAVVAAGAVAAISAWPSSPTRAPQPIAAPPVATAQAPATAITPAPSPAPSPPPLPAAAPKTVPSRPPAAPTKIATAPRRLTPAQEDQLVEALHPPFNRANAIASMAEFCDIPYDAAHPDPATKPPLADWGKVTKVEKVVEKLGDREIPLVIYTVSGQRRTYRLQDGYGALGFVDPKVGQWITLCHERDGDFYQLGISQSHQVVPGSGPPRIIDFAKLAPLHTTSIKLMIQGQQGKLTIPTDRRYLVYARVENIDGSRIELNGWSVELPIGTPGAGTVHAKKSSWFIVEDPAFDTQPDGTSRLVFRAAAVIDQLFP
ncbi:MAG: putative serine/threonine protein kinase [Myxococcales bacterium]|nr:putative serine/threonine protein kinase [Myxococcales bacterium]